MSAGSPSFNLLTLYGWRNCWMYGRRRIPRQAIRDTLGPVLCWLAGDHVIRQDWSRGDGTPETSCTCCRRWLEQDGYNWRVKRL